MKKDNSLKSGKGKIIAGLSLVMVVAVSSAFALPAMAANSNSSVTADHTEMVQTAEVKDSANEASEDALLASQVKITEAQAITTVEAANPNATVTCDELGNENGTAAYQLTVTAADGTKSEVKVDANTGAILSATGEDADTEENDANEANDANDAEENDAAEGNDSANETSEDAALASQVKLSEAQAIAIVETANPGTSVTCDELGNENGTAAYELKMTASDGSKSEAMVDANTGTILPSSDTEGNYEG